MDSFWWRWSPRIVGALIGIPCGIWVYEHVLRHACF